MSDVDSTPATPGEWRPIAGAVGASLLAGAVTMAIFGDLAFGLDPADLLTGATLLGLLAAVIVLPGRRAAAATAALVAVWLVGYAAYAWIPDQIDLPVPVSDAVGGAAFYMSSYVDQQVAEVVYLLTVVAAGIVIAIVAGRRAGVQPPEGERTVRRGTEAAAPPRRVKLIAIGVVALVAVSLLPDLHKALIDGTSGKLPSGWDAANLVSWDAFQQRGLAPMKDFWYPYGTTWLLTDFPTGPGARWLWQGAMLAATGWALWRLAGPKPVRIALCLLAFVAIGSLDPVDTLGLPFVWRYLPALVVGACYAAMGPLRHRRPGFGHLVFGLVCGAVGAMEADILVAGLGGAAFVGLGELVFDPALRTWRTLRPALVDLIPVAAGLAFMLLCWAVAGTLSQNAHWFTSFRAVSAASASFQETSGALVGLRADPSQVTMIVTIPALALVVAAFQRRFGGPAGAASSMLLLAAAGVGTVLLAKHLVRPQGPLVTLFPVIALMWVAILQWQARAIRGAIAAGLFIGAVLGALQASANVKPTRYAVRALATPVRAVQDLGLILDRGKVHVAGAKRFAPERFVGIPEKDRIADPLATTLAGTGDDRFATLGDAQILYVLFGERPPWQISMYDASPSSQQREWIDDVRDRRTKLLVWRRDLAVDYVPYHVRDPLVFGYAIANYTIQARGEAVDLLRRLRPGEHADERYWRSRLGTTVDLGGIPSYSHGDDAERCEGGAGCVPYALVTRSGAGTGAKVTVKLDGTPYGVELSRRKNVDSYAIRLDRLWFWPFAHHATALSMSAPGWKVQRVDVKAGDDLY